MSGTTHEADTVQTTRLRPMYIDGQMDRKLYRSYAR